MLLSFTDIVSGVFVRSSAGACRIVCARYPATTGRHALQGLYPAFAAASAERKRLRFSGFILLALRQVAWQKIPVVGVARYGEPANSPTGTPSPSSSLTFSSAPNAYRPVLPSFLTTRWQGTRSGTGLFAITVPTAREAPALPASRATQRYGLTSPRGMPPTT